MVTGYELIGRKSEDISKCLNRLVATIEEINSVLKAVVVEKEELYHCLFDVCEQLNLAFS